MSTPGGAARVTLHYAQTLDGRIATRTGDARWISGEASLRFAHELRAAHDAVMVGVGTILADDPQLTVRLVDGPSPRRVVVDTSLRLPPASSVAVDRSAPTLVATAEPADPERAATLRAGGVDVVTLPRGAGGVDLAVLLDHLGERGVGSVLVEGGSRLITSLLRQRLVTRIVVCLAPKLVGSGIDAVGDLGILRLCDAMHIGDPTVRVLGDDVIVEGSLATAAAPVAQR